MDLNTVIQSLTPEFFIACFWIVFYPSFWNAVGRFEYYTGLVSKIFCGPRVAVILLAICIEALNLTRTAAFRSTLEAHGKTEWLINPIGFGLGICCLAVGTTMVLASYWMLGFYGTFLGDHFGILMEGGPVTSFPFNITDNPMYWGGALNYLGITLCSGSAIGFALMIPIIIVYKIVIYFEEPFTTKLYSEKKKK